MNLEEHLAELLRRAERHQSSRSADVAAAAKRVKVLLLETVRRHTAADVPATLAVEAALEASALLANLDGRGAREARARRAEQLARARPPARRKVTDEALLAACGRGGGCRQVARRLRVAPSTVIRRLRALQSVTERNGDARA